MRRFVHEREVARGPGVIDWLDAVRSLAARLAARGER